MNDSVWCWWFDAEEMPSLHVPFSSKQEAIDNAYDHAGPHAGEHIQVAKARKVAPHMYVHMDGLDILSLASDEFLENEVMYFGNGSEDIFKIYPDKVEDAERALVALFKQWAEKYVTTEIYVPINEGELVIL